MSAPSLHIESTDSMIVSVHIHELLMHVHTKGYFSPHGCLSYINNLS